MSLERPNTLRISLPSLHLALSLVLSPRSTPSKPTPRPRWLSSWFPRTHWFVCQVRTGEAAGCTLTSLCHFHSDSHQVGLRCRHFPRGSFQACASNMEKGKRWLEAGSALDCTIIWQIFTARGVWLIFFWQTFRITAYSVLYMLGSDPLSLEHLRHKVIKAVFHSFVLVFPCLDLSLLRCSSWWCMFSDT